MGKCNCKGNRTSSGKEFLRDSGVSGFLTTKFAFWLIFILTAVITIPLMIILSARAIILGKPIDLTKLITILRFKKKNKPVVDEQ